MQPNLPNCAINKCSQTWHSEAFPRIRIPCLPSGSCETRISSSFSHTARNSGAISRTSAPIISGLASMAHIDIADQAWSRVKAVTGIFLPWPFMKPCRTDIYLYFRCAHLVERESCDGDFLALAIHTESTADGQHVCVVEAPWLCCCDHRSVIHIPRVHSGVSRARR